MLGPSLEKITSELMSKIGLSEKAETYLPIVGSDERFFIRYTKDVKEYPMNILSLYSESMKPIGFMQFMGPIYQEIESQNYSVFLSQNSLDFKLNEKFKAPEAYSIFVSPGYRNRDGKYKGVAYGLYSLSLAIAQSLTEKKGIFIVSSLCTDSKNSMKKYKGFELEYNKLGQAEAVSWIPGYIPPLEISRLR